MLSSMQGLLDRKLSFEANLCAGIATMEAVGGL
jgi:hypothetical protein